MLYVLPVEATFENWLCDLLNAALDRGFNDIDAKRPISDWLIGVDEARKRRLLRRGKLREALYAVLLKYQALDEGGRAVVRAAFDDQRHLSDLFAGNRIGLTLAGLPEDIHASLKEYADRVFDTLDDFRIRERSYEVHDRLNAAACPFCGYEAMDNSRVRSMDWDHYLARSLYPFAGADLRNFSPMGDACNGTFKQSKDVLRSNGGLRRRCFEPYVSPPGAIDLRQSKLFARGAGLQLPEWQINFVGDPECCASWDSIFELKTRWEGQLDRVYDHCLDHFMELNRGKVLNDNELADQLLRLMEANRKPEVATGAFLRCAVYDLLQRRVLQDDEEGRRVRNFLRNFLLPLQA